MNIRTLLLLSLPALGAGLGRAQEAAAHQLPDRTPIHALQFDDQAPQLWASGRAYKASFHDGMTFVPYLGADYPHNQPFAWRTTAVRCGEVDLLAPGSVPVPHHARYRAEYDFGPVVEAYDVLPEGLEQTFVFAQRPATGGDLVIRGAVATGLSAAAPEAAHQDLVYRDEQGRAIVTYGAATAVDADGHRYAMTTRCVDGEIALTLAASAVAAARFPLVVDPLVAPQLTSTIGMVCSALDSDIAVAEGAHTQMVLEVFSYQVSAADSDIWVYATGVAFNGSAWIFGDTSTEDSKHVRGAYVAGTDRWVIVYQALDAFGVSRIRAHVHDVDDTATGTVVRSILNVAGVHDWRPDVGGTRTGGNKALVVFQRENTGATFADTATSAVMGDLLDTSTTYGTWQGAFQISSVGNYDAERPSVNQQCEGGAGAPWMVVDQEYNNGISGDDWDLVGRRVDAASTVLAGNWISDFAAASPARHQLGPVVEGHDGRYAVVFSTVETTVGKTTSALGRNVWIETFEWAANAPSPSAAGNMAPSLLHSSTGRVFYATGLAFDAHTRSHWAATWRGTAPAPEILWFARCSHSGYVQEGPLQVYAAAGGEVISDAAVAFDAGDGRYRLHYDVSNAVNTKVWGRFLAYPASVGTSHHLSGCGTATIELSGPAPAPFTAKNALIGTRGAFVAGSSAHANDLHFLVVGLGLTNQPIAHPLVAPGCALLVPTNDIGILPLQIGAYPAWPMALPENLVSTHLFFQDWVYDPTANQLTATDRLSVSFER